MRSPLSSTLLRQTLQRPALRQRVPRSRNTRFASSNAENAQKKAQDALATAQATAEKVWGQVKTLLGPAGEKAGQLLGSYKEPLFYNFAVTREIIKKIYIAEGLQPPTLAAVREAYCSIWTRLSAPGGLRAIVDSGRVAQIGVYGLQAYTIFKVGEILGRRSLVGYKTH